MKKRFVTYEIAKDLEKFSFDLESFGYFWDNGKFDIGSFCDHSKRDLPIISAPLWQDVVEWFEIIHGLELITKSWKEGGKIIYLYSVNKLGSPSSYRHGEYTSESRYDARTRCIIDAIDILKNK